MVNKVEASTPDRSSDLVGLSIAAVAALGLTMTVLFLCVVPLAGNLAGSRDFVAYWATGQQLARHANPYDREAISALEHAASLDARAVLVMRNPPWALPLAYPLGFLGIRIAAVLWSLLLAGCLALSVALVRRLEGSPSGPVHWLGMAFTPALLCLTMGQMALLALLGLVLFLRYHAERPFAAGAALWFCLLKPHLFLPFAAALGVWIIYTRAWPVIAGTFAALALSSAATWLIAPNAWPDYLAMMASPAVENDFIPCLADAFRLWFWPQAIWIQYLPALLCSAWAVLYFWQRRAQWSWTAHGSALILVSLVAAPYCWLYDQCLAIPALLHGAYTTRNRNLLAILAVLILAADLQIGFVKVTSPLWLWAAPAWLAWFFLASASWPARDRHAPGEAAR